MLRPILDKDPAVNPPCIVSSGCVNAVHITPESSTAADPQPSTSAPKNTTGTRKRRSDLITSIEKMTEEANQHKKLIADELKALVNEEKRRNDLFEKFIDTLNKQ